MEYMDAERSAILLNIKTHLIHCEETDGLLGEKKKKGKGSKKSHSRALKSGTESELGTRVNAMARSCFTKWGSFN